MKSRLFDFVLDYSDICQWWLGWRGWDTPVKSECLPQTGIIVENNGEKLCSCFIYRTDSAWCVINWFLMNPKAKKENRKGCIEFLIKAATKKAKDMGFKYVDVMVDKESVIKKLEKEGYKRAEILTRIIKRL